MALTASRVAGSPAERRGKRASSASKGGADNRRITSYPRGNTFAALGLYRMETAESPPIVVGLAAVVVLVLANAFFVAAEFALVGARRTRLDEMARAGDGKARLARRAVQSLDRYISATQLGITLASLGLGWIGEPALAGLIDGRIQLAAGVARRRSPPTAWPPPSPSSSSPPAHHPRRAGAEGAGPALPRGGEHAGWPRRSWGSPGSWPGRSRCSTAPPTGCSAASASAAGRARAAPFAGGDPDAGRAERGGRQPAQAGRPPPRGRLRVQREDGAGSDDAAHADGRARRRPDRRSRRPTRSPSRAARGTRCSPRVSTRSSAWSTPRTS